MQKLYVQKIYKYFVRTEQDLFGQDMTGRWYVFMDNHFTEFLAIGFQV